jgi:hypothetical protein
MRKSEWIACGLGGAMVLAVAAVFGATHYNVLLHRAAPQTAAVNTDSSGLKFPSVDEMCKAAGAVGADLQQCISDETSAAEFVGAWLDLNGFINDGRIDIEQIQLQAQLASVDQGINPPAGDPLDPLSDPPADPAQDALPPSPDADPLAPPSGGEATPPAQVALLCLGTASDDWLKMHDCIAQNDPSSTLEGN